MSHWPLGVKMKPYGHELILDLHGCDPERFNRKTIRAYLKALCKAIGMQPCELHFWDDIGVPSSRRQTEPHLKGTSAVQFILTSNVTIHTLDELGAVYVNIFSCKPFNSRKAAALTREWFGGRVVQKLSLDRK